MSLFNARNWGYSPVLWMTWLLKVPKQFIELIQMQVSRLQLGQTKQPYCMLASTTHEIHKQEKCLSYQPDCVEGGHWISINGGCPPILKFPPCSVIRAKGGQKTINFLAIFMCLSDTNYEHLECFVMLGTHSKLKCHIYVTSSVF